MQHPAVVVLVVAAIVAAAAGCAEADCGEGTFERDGECVAVQSADEPVECGEGTELDPNANECVSTDAACGEATALDSDEDECVPTDEVCDEGTSFDEQTGLCYPAPDCEAGAQIMDGECLTEAEQFAQDPEVVVDGDTDPETGGEPVEISVGDVDDPTSFAGTLGESADPGDDPSNPGPDVLKFDADAGDWIEVAIWSLGLPDPALKVVGADEDLDFERRTARGVDTDKTRQLIVPETGTYHLRVYPGAALAGQMLGPTDWSYVGTLAEVETGQPEEHRFVDGALEGTLGAPGDNYVEVDETELESFNGYHLSWDRTPGAAAEVLQVWDSQTGFVQQLEGNGTIETPETGELYLIADWIDKYGFENHDYALRGEPVLDLESGDTHELDFSAIDHDGVDVWWTHGGTGGSVELEVTDVDGETVVEGEVGPDEPIRHLGLDEGGYTAAFTNTGGELFEDFSARISLAGAQKTESFEAEFPEWFKVEHDYSEELLVGVVNEEAGELVDTFAMESHDFLGATAPEEADYSVRLWDFEGDVDVEDIEWTVTIFEAQQFHSWTVAADDAGGIFEITHDYQEEDSAPDWLNVGVVEQGGDRLLEEGLLRTNDHAMALVALEEGDYEVFVRANEGPDPGEVDFNVETVEPTEVTESEFGDDFQGSANESPVGAHDYYRVEVETTQTVEMTLEHEGDSGFGRLFVYGPGHQQLARMEESICDFDPLCENLEETTSFEFEADTPRIVRVGNDRTGFESFFDYTLTVGN